MGRPGRVILVGLLLVSAGIATAAPPPGIYWTDGATDRVRLNGLDGLSGSDLITTDIVNPQQIAVTDGHIWYADSNGRKIVRANHDGSDIRIIHEDLPLPVGLAVVQRPDSIGNRMYWSELGPPGRIRSSNLNGSNAFTHVTDLMFPQGIAVTDTHIYWADLLTKKVQRKAIGTNLPVEDLVTEADGLDDPLAVAVGGGYLFWGDTGTDKIQRSTLEGNAITDIVTADDGLSFPHGLSVVEDYIYWTDELLNKIGRARIDGGGVTDILTDVGANYIVAVPPERPIGVFVTGSAEGGGGGIRHRVERVGLDNKNLVRLYDTSGAHTGGLCLADFHLYWSDSLQSRVFRANFDGSDVVEVARQLPERPGALAVSDTHIYWTSSDSFNIHRMDLHGGSLEVIQSGENVYPGDIAVHGGRLYWSESHGFGDGIIRRSNDDGSGDVDLLVTFGLVQLDVTEDGVFYTDSGVWKAGIDSGSAHLIVPQEGPSSPSSIVATETHVFWNEGGLIHSARHDGGGRRFVATAISATSIEASHPPSQPGVYWARSAGHGNSSIRRANFDGTGVVDVVAGLNRTRDVAVDDFYLFWVEHAGGGIPNNIGRCYHDGSHVETIATLQPNSDFAFVATNGSRVFWTDRFNDLLESADLDGSNRIPLVSDIDLAVGLTADDEYIYCAQSNGRITRVDHSGLNPRVMVPHADFPVDVEVTDQYLYWTDGRTHSPGTISRGLLSGSAGAVDLATDLEDPTGIAVSGEHVYWTDVETHTVRLRTPTGRITTIHTDPDEASLWGIDAWGSLTLPTPVITGINLLPHRTIVTVRIDSPPPNGGTLNLFRSRDLGEGDWDVIFGTSVLPVFQRANTFAISFNDAIRTAQREFYRASFRSNP